LWCGTGLRPLRSRAGLRTLHGGARTLRRGTRSHRPLRCWVRGTLRLRRAGSGGTLGCRLRRSGDGLRRTRYRLLRPSGRLRRAHGANSGSRSRSCSRPCSWPGRTAPAVAAGRLTGRIHRLSPALMNRQSRLRNHLPSNRKPRCRACSQIFRALPMTLLPDVPNVSPESHMESKYGERVDGTDLVRTGAGRPRRRGLTRNAGRSAKRSFLRSRTNWTAPYRYRAGATCAARGRSAYRPTDCRD